MGGNTIFEVRKDDPSVTRCIEHPVSLSRGQALIRIHRFAVTANNVTYAMVGDRIGYWKFFPASTDGWGVVPVWGLAEVVDSRTPDVPVGERLYGYWPMGGYLVIEPAGVGERQLFDGAAHRAELPPTYNRYLRLLADPDYDPSLDDARMALWPLYATSFCLHDFLSDRAWHGAGQIIVPSASSKTAIGLAYAVKDDPAAPEIIGVTSAANAGMVEALALYDRVISYDDIETGLADRPSVIVDMSGSGDVLGRLHRKLGENMRYTSNVGLTHYAENRMGADFIRDRSEMFFAPGHIQKRAKDWGPGEFERRAAEFWRDAAIRSRDWLSISRHYGPDALAQVWDTAIRGVIPPDMARVVSL